MKLSQKYSQFKDKNILLIVAGKHDAVFYKAEHGVVDKVTSFSIPKPEYSDNEGKFQKSAHGQLWSGSVEVRNDDSVVRAFVQELGKKTKEVKGTFSDIYIFAPKNTKHKIVPVLPEEWQKRVVDITQGNYYKQSPTFFFDKISSSKEKPFTAPKKEEKKILNKADQARGISKG